MPALKQLSAIYIGAATAFAVTALLAQHARWNAGVHAALHVAGAQTVVAARYLDRLALEPARAFLVRSVAPMPPSRVTIDLAPGAPAPRLQPPRSKPLEIRPSDDGEIGVAALDRRGSADAPKLQALPQVTIDIAPSSRPGAREQHRPPTRAELASVKRRLEDNLTAPLYRRFDLFLYVSKAAKGPLAQRMYVFAKTKSGGLRLRYDWEVSTGREKIERNKAGAELASFTPQGYYELDPHRMYRHYRSVQWNMPMPHAMFFNWIQHGRRTGIAIHAAHGKAIARLGTRASGGCIHLSPKHAARLFRLIRVDYKGRVPRFAFNRRTDSISNNGRLMRGPDGRLRFAEGYKVLVVIESFGRSDLVASIM